MDKPSPRSFEALRSERLLLRRFHDSDLKNFLAYSNDPEVARYQLWESFTEEEARDQIEAQKHLEFGLRGKWFLYAVELKTSHELIGHVALKILDDQQAEIGFTFAREYQGQGLAFEASSCVMNYVFDRLGLHRVTAVADCENQKSLALLARLGMRLEGHFIQNIWFKGRWGDEYSYAILKDEWLRQHATNIGSDS